MFFLNKKRMAERAESKKIYFRCHLSCKFSVKYNLCFCYHEIKHHIVSPWCYFIFSWCKWATNLISETGTNHYEVLPPKLSDQYALLTPSIGVFYIVGPLDMELLVLWKLDLWPLDVGLLALGSDVGSWLVDPGYPIVGLRMGNHSSKDKAIFSRNCWQSLKGGSGKNEQSRQNK